MGLLADLVAVLQTQYGWLLVAGLILYELYAPILVGRDTALAPLVRDLPERVEDIDEKQDTITSDIDDVQNHVEEVQDRQKVQMQVQRAQARATDQMDEDRVDKYLLRNGVKPEDFIKGNEMMGYANWEDEDSDSDEQSQQQHYGDTDE